MSPQVDPGQGSRAVAIGGGHGLSRTLQGLTRVVGHVTAIVTAADDGGSSGRLRRDLGVLPPGDLRMAVAALAGDERLAQLLQYRFDRGELAGHSLGNLILVALEQLNEGDIVRALDEVARLLGVRGRVLPCTTTPVMLRADTEGGLVEGQAAVARTARVGRVWLQPQHVPATPEAVTAIERADLIVLGPGSLYTSLIPNLLVGGIADAVSGSKATVVFVANLREQAGETEGMTIEDHLEALAEHAPGVRANVLLAHEGPEPSGQGKPLTVDRERLTPWVDRIETLALLDGSDGHAPARLAAVFDAVLRGVSVG